MSKTIVEKLQVRSVELPKDGDKLKSLVVDEKGNVKVSANSGEENVSPLSIVEFDSSGSANLEPNMLIQSIIVENAEGITSIVVGDEHKQLVEETFEQAVSDNKLIFQLDLVQIDGEEVFYNAEPANPDRKIKLVVLSV